MTRYLHLLLLLLLLPPVESIAQSEYLDKLPKYPLKAITGYCQSDTSLVISKEDMFYNDKQELVEIVQKNLSLNNVIVRKVNYNSQGKISSIVSAVSDPEGKLQTSTIAFDYNSSGLLILEKQEDLHLETKYEYNSKRQLAQKTVSGKDWEIIYNYEYNKDGILKKRLKEGKPDLEILYSKGLVSKEIENRNEIKEEIIYAYNDAGLLIRKEKPKRFLEKNEYIGERLISNTSSDFQSDACIEQPCCMKWIKRFEYYAQ
jgi:hypothetical protein